MRSLLKKSKSLLAHSDKVKSVLRQMPETAAEIQGLVAQATKTIQQLRVDADSLMGDLRVENEDHFGEVLRDVTKAQAALLDAGYVLGGASINLGSLPAAWSVGKPAVEFGRLTIHLEKLEGALNRKVVAEPNSSRTLRAVFYAIERAQELAEKMLAFGLALDELLITIGPLPSIKIVWANTVLEDSTDGEVSSFTATTSTPIKQSWSTGDEGFFPERPRNVPTKVAPAPAVTAAETKQEAEPGAETGSLDPLARFKRMPDLNR